MKTWIAGTLTLIGLSFGQGLTHAQDKGIAVTLTITKDITRPTPVCVPLIVTPAQAKWTMVASDKTWGQLSSPGLMTDRIRAIADNNEVRRDLHLILDGKLAAGTSLKFSFTPLRLGDVYVPSYHWKDTKGRHVDLLNGQIPVLRYMYQAYDDSSTERRNKTYKVFHHLFNPAGKRLVTNGGWTDDVTDPKKLLYPHHRGLQMGFYKTIYANGAKKADTWHCPKDDHQSHEGFLKREGDLLMGRHRVAIDWHGEKKEVIVKEVREMTVYKVPGGTLLDFASRLTPASGKVKLDGDPQHAGFQFRAANEVAEKTAKQTYYLRPDGKGDFGATRNWSPKDRKHVNLPWDAMSFVLGDQRYTVCYLDHPQNPHEARFSERDYGRFGCYFEREITPDRPLLLNYRIWLQEGEMTVEQVQALSDQFVSPPQARR